MTQGDLRLLAWLLHHANAHPEVMQDEFYAVKDSILTTYGSLDGEDIQHVVAQCWGSGGICDEECEKCGGTGIYYEHWTRLIRYRLDRYVFHRPVERLAVKPERVQIEGLIRHKYYPDLSRECVGALLWRYSPQTFNRWLSAYHFSLPRLRLLRLTALRQLPPILRENPTRSLSLGGTSTCRGS